MEASPIQYWSATLLGNWVMFENGTIVIDLSDTNKNDLANSAIAILTGIDSASDAVMPVTRNGLSLGWICNSCTHNKVWVRILDNIDASQASSMAQKIIDDDRESLKIIYINMINND